MGLLQFIDDLQVERFSHRWCFIRCVCVCRCVLCVSLCGQRCCVCVCVCVCVGVCCVSVCVVCFSLWPAGTKGRLCAHLQRVHSSEPVSSCQLYRQPFLLSRKATGMWYDDGLPVISQEKHAHTLAHTRSLLLTLALTHPLSHSPWHSLPDPPGLIPSYCAFTHFSLYLSVSFFPSSPLSSSPPLSLLLSLR